MLEAILALGLVVLDQLTKLWAAGALVTQYGGSLPVIQGVFHFTYVENRGAAFSMLQNQRWIFIVLSVVLSAVILWVLIKKRKNFKLLTRICLVMLLAGGIGNLIDRVFLGYVRDMFDFCLINFPVFNVADSCITIGAILLVIAVFTDSGLYELLGGKKKEPAAAAEISAVEQNVPDQSQNDGSTEEKIVSAQNESDGGAEQTSTPVEPDHTEEAQQIAKQEEDSSAHTNGV